jgi:ATP phosphoribosyltransferase regulatory subunit
MTESTPFFPTPHGVRDMLPQEMGELNSLLAPVRGELVARRFEELHTPALEYESVIAMGDVESTDPAFRLLDDEGRMLVLRPDMTIPTVRLVATRLRKEQPPFRFYYVSHIYRGKPLPGRSREFLQLGAELIGRSGLAATLELLETLVAVLDLAGLTQYSIVVGNADLFPRLMKTLEVPPGARDDLIADLAARNFVGMKRRLEGLMDEGAISPRQVELLTQVAQSRGSVEILDRLPEEIKDVAPDLIRISNEAEGGVRDRLVFDLGMLPTLNYYSGEIFQVHHPAVGQPIGGGGRYDQLLARFGRPLEAVGFGVSLELLHTAKLSEDGLSKPLLESSEGSP